MCAVPNERAVEHNAYARLVREDAASTAQLSVFHHLTALTSSLWRPPTKLHAPDESLKYMQSLQTRSLASSDTELVPLTIRSLHTLS
jgi:hypothetical protein